MRVHSLALATATLTLSALAVGCKKNPPPPAPGTAVTTQPVTATGPNGQPVTLPAGTPITQPAPGGQPTAVAPATTAADAPVAPGTVVSVPANTPVAAAPATSATTNSARTVAAAPAPAPTFVVPAGTRVTVRTNQSLSGEHDDVGTPFGGSLNNAVVVRGTTVFPRGTEVRGEIVSAKGRGRFKGAGYLGIALTSIGGYRVTTSEYSVRHKGRGKRTAGFIGGGAGLGALIGGLAGGGKGALIGGLSGAGAGTAAGAYTGSRDVVIPAESAVSFTTRSTITVKR